LITARRKVSDVGTAGSRPHVDVAPVAVRSVSSSPLSSRHDLDPLTLPAGARVELEVDIPCDAAWMLTSDRSLAPVAPRAVSPPIVGRFLVVSRGGRHARWELPFATRLDALRTAEGVRVTTLLRDPNACGVSLWGPGRIADPPSPVALSIFEDVLGTPEDCLWLEPYPNGGLAAVCLTDHSDFDTAERCGLLADLFGSLGLRITKGVFPASEPQGRKNEPGLDTPDYARTVEAFHAAGSEIAFHGIGPRREAPPPDECRRRAETMRRFAPRTWIDHGTGAYLFSRDAALSDGTPLTAFLSDYGVENFWSYVDVWNNPFGHLSGWRPRGDVEAAMDGLRAASATWGRGGGAAAWAYPASHVGNNLLSEIGTHALRSRPWSPSAWSRARSLRSRFRRLTREPLLIYGRDGRTPALGASEPIIFDTVLLNHPLPQLAPERVADLCADSGLLIAHTYLACTLRHIRGGCFEDRQGPPALRREFVDHAANLADRQRARDLSVLPLSDLRRALTAFGQSRLERVADGWRLLAPDQREVVVAGAPGAVAGLESAGGRIVMHGRRGLALGLAGPDRTLPWRPGAG
jgi:hypothetical protein